MFFLGLEFEVKSLPKNDAGFIPLPVFARRHQEVATQPFAVVYERAEDDISVYDTKVIGTPEYRETDLYYLERLLLSLEKAWGGHTLYLYGDADLAEVTAAKFREGGQFADPPKTSREAYGRDFSIQILPYGKLPETRLASTPLGGSTKGCRIGFDAGGSDIKVCAVIDGDVVFEEEREWTAKEQPDIDYHYGYIVQALKDAAACMPRVDFVGISGPGTFNAKGEALYMTIYKSLPPEALATRARTLFIDAVKELGSDIPYVAMNDGHIAAIAGSMQLGGAKKLIGLPLGTFVGGGYVDEYGGFSGMRIGLGTMPIDCNPNAPLADFSKTIGCAGIYIAQDGVLRITDEIGIETKGETLAKRLKEVQALANSGDEAALSVFYDVGVFLGHSLAWYNHFYKIDHVVIMGRVTSGSGGDLIYKQAIATLAADWPECKLKLHMPGEMTRRLGQAVAAASL